MTHQTLLKEDVTLKVSSIFQWQKKPYEVRRFKNMIQVMGVRGEPILSLSEDEAVELAGKIDRIIEDKYAATYELLNTDKVF